MRVPCPANEKTPGRAELKQTGVFLLPGFAKFEVTEKPATEAREGVNPFTKEPMTFAAKPGMPPEIWLEFGVARSPVT
jgi:Bacterial DNA-binding protein